MKKIVFYTTIVLFLLSIWGCEKDLQGNLTAARKIEGTWKTNLPIKFYIKTDFCTGVLEDVATDNRDVTMEIKETGDNSVDIIMSFFTSNFSITNENCDNSSGYTPDVSPMFLQGSNARSSTFGFCRHTKPTLKNQKSLPFPTAPEQIIYIIYTVF